ncbi:MAG: hypothetical protein QMC94_05770 [Anaerosomatales bacterium]|nr:hypothetical protein [Anaerosomatales bacterium]
MKMRRRSGLQAVLALCACASLLIAASAAYGAGGVIYGQKYYSSYWVLSRIDVTYVINSSNPHQIRVSKVHGSWKCDGTRASRYSISKAALGAYEAGDIGGVWSTGTWWWTSYTVPSKTVDNFSYSLYETTSYFSTPWVFAYVRAASLGGQAKGLLYTDSAKSPVVISVSAFKSDTIEGW